ncbi:TonB-dependent receptor plug domain-containing protein [Treponema sp.]|uniref:TonB-dependent receptor plug domain-containing protein n=1 Tax=Treponema sp. TaxID=166 RepID=UPI00388D6E70
MIQKKLLKKTQIFFIAILFSVSSFAQESDFEDADDAVISVNAGRISQNVSEEVQKTEVITDEEIRKSGSKTVGDALKSLPGINVSNASAGNANESVTMQGLGTGYVKIMIDGVTVSTDISGSTPVFQIPVENIDHIEVIKGADSVLYGSEAMGGAINVVTKNNIDKSGEDKKISVSGNLTEEIGFSPSIKDWKDYTALSLFANGTNLSNALIACLNYVPGKEKTASDALAGSITYYENTKKILGFARDTLTWKDEWGNIALYGLYADSYQVSNYTKTGYDKGSDMEYRSTRGEAGLTGKYILGDSFYIDGFTAGKLYFLDTTYNVKAGAYSSSKSTESDSADWETDLRAHIKPTDFQDITAGVNANLESIDGTSFEERKYALETSLFAQDSILFFDEKLTVVPGIRFDFAPSLSGGSTNFMATPKLSFKYNPVEKTALRLSYGMGYKIPSLREKYWIFRHNYAPGSGNFILYGNENLVPEKSHSFNAGWEQNVSDVFKFSVEGYFNYIIDLIDSVVTDAASTPQIREYQNVDKAVTYGGELSLSSDWDVFKIKAGYALTFAKYFDEQIDSWENLALRVKHRITASAEYTVPVIETTLSVNAQWNSPQLLSSGTDYYTPDYFMLGADISKKFWDEKLTVYFGIDNILNNLHFKKGTNGENQKDYYGLTEGTVLRLGVKINF